MKLVKILGLALLAFQISCGGGGSDDPKEPEPDPGPFPVISNDIEAGWDAFEAGNFAAAETAFTAAIDSFPGSDSLNQAYAGRGWAKSRQQNYASGVTDFTIAGTNQDAQAGKSFAELIRKNYTSAVSVGKLLIAANSTYQFAYDASVDISDVRLTVAQASFYLGIYSDLIAQLDVLSPGHGLTTNSDPVDLLQAIMDLQ